MNGGKLLSVKDENRALLCISVFFIIFHFARTFSNNFWGDEAFTVILLRESYQGIIDITSMDVHPPLYYFIVKGFCDVFGYSYWAYHFCSFIPFVILMAVNYTVVKRWFGIRPAIVLALFLCILSNSFNFIIEVRMYEWGMLFVFLTTLAAYGFCHDPSLKNCVLIVVFALLAAYTHLYFTLSAGLILLSLLIVTMVWDRRDAYKVILCSIASFIGFLPWLSITISTVNRVTDDFWMTRIPFLAECVGYSFGDRFMIIPAIFCFLLILTVLFHEFGKDIGPFAKHLMKEERQPLSDVKLLLIMVLIPVIGTNLIGLIVSYTVRPVFDIRYAYSTLAGLWLLMGVVITRYVPDYKAMKKTLIIVLVFAIPMSSFYLAYDVYQCVETSETLSATGDVGDGDYLITDDVKLDITVLECYYPGVKTVLVKDGDFSSHTKSGMDNWLFINDRLSDSQRSEFESMGYSVEPVILDSHLAQYSVNVYHLVHA